MSATPSLSQVMPFESITPDLVATQLASVDMNLIAAFKAGRLPALHQEMDKQRATIDHLFKINEVAESSKNVAIAGLFKTPRFLWELITIWKMRTQAGFQDQVIKLIHVYDSLENAARNTSWARTVQPRPKVKKVQSTGAASLASAAPAPMAIHLEANALDMGSREHVLETSPVSLVSTANSTQAPEVYGLSPLSQQNREPTEATAAKAKATDLPPAPVTLARASAFTLSPIAAASPPEISFGSTEVGLQTKPAVSSSSQSQPSHTNPAVTTVKAKRQSQKAKNPPPPPVQEHNELDEERERELLRPKKKKNSKISQRDSRTGAVTRRPPEATLPRPIPCDSCARAGCHCYEQKGGRGACFQCSSRKATCSYNGHKVSSLPGSRPPQTLEEMPEAAEDVEEDDDEALEDLDEPPQMVRRSVPAKASHSIAGDDFSEDDRSEDQSRPADHGTFGFRKGKEPDLMEPGARNLFGKVQDITARLVVLEETMKKCHDWQEETEDLRRQVISLQEYLGMPKDVRRTPRDYNSDINEHAFLRDKQSRHKDSEEDDDNQVSDGAADTVSAAVTPHAPTSTFSPALPPRIMPTPIDSRSFSNLVEQGSSTTPAPEVLSGGESQHLRNIRPSTVPSLKLIPPTPAASQVAQKNTRSSSLGTSPLTSTPLLSKDQSSHIRGEKMALPVPADSSVSSLSPGPSPLPAPEMARAGIARLAPGVVNLSQSPSRTLEYGAGMRPVISQKPLTHQEFDHSMLSTSPNGLSSVAAYHPSTPCPPTPILTKNDHEVARVVAHAPKAPSPFSNLSPIAPQIFLSPLFSAQSLPLPSNPPSPLLAASPRRSRRLTREDEDGACPDASPESESSRCQPTQSAFQVTNAKRKGHTNGAGQGPKAKRGRH